MRMSDLFGQRFGRPNVYYPELRHVTGSNNATIFMCKLLFWSDKGSSPDGWIYKTMDEMTVETGLSRREQEGARKLLVERGILYEKFKGIPRKLFFYVDRDKLDELGDEWFYGDNTEQNQHNAQNSHYCMAESANKERLKPPSNKTQNSHSLYNRDNSKDDNREKESPPKTSKCNPGETKDHSQALNPTSTKVICDEASVGVVVGKSKAVRNNPQRDGGVGSAINKSSSVDAQGLSSEDVAGVVARVTAALNQAIDSSFQISDSEKHITNCLKIGMTETELMAVVDHISGWVGNPEKEDYLAPIYIFGSRAGEYARRSKKSGKGKPRPVAKKRQYYLIDPVTNPEAVLVDEDEIPVGTDAWDKDFRRIVL